MNERGAGRPPGRVESALRVRLNAGCVLFWLTDFLIVMLQRAKQCKGNGEGDVEEGPSIRWQLSAFLCLTKGMRDVAPISICFLHLLLLPLLLLLLLLALLKAQQDKLSGR